MLYQQVFICNVIVFLSIILDCPGMALCLPRIVSGGADDALAKMRQVTDQVILTLWENTLVGQLVTHNQEMSFTGRLDGKELHEGHVPAFVYGQIGSEFGIQRNLSLPPTHFSSPNIAHINALLRQGSDGISLADPLWLSVYKRCIGSSGSSVLSPRLLLRDFFIGFENHSHMLSQTGLLLATKPLSPRNVLWICFERITRDWRGEFLYDGLNNEKAEPNVTCSISKADAPQVEFARSGTRRQEEFMFHISYRAPCSGEANNSGREIQDGRGCEKGNGSNDSALAYVLCEVSSRLKLSITITTQTPKKSGIRKRHTLSSLGERKSGMLLNSLVFLAQKRFRSLEDALTPLNLFTSLMIVVTSAAVTLALAVIRVVTSGPEQTWYDCFIQQVLDLIQDARRKKCDQKNGEADVDFGSVGGSGEDEGEARERDRGVGGASGRISTSVLHGTVQIVSFILVAIYEGKLYSTITLPKSRFISTFDELLANDKYAIKISREAADVSLILGTKNVSIINRFSQSFNIEDCISWAERSVSHGCVAYDFELHSLPKTQRAKMLQTDKFFAKTKTSIIGRPRTPIPFHPAAHISRWILEAGFFQFWMLAENVFTESLITSKMSAQKLFSIQDYLGLLVIYTFLLFVATLVFCSEMMVAWVRPCLHERSLWEILTVIKGFIMSLARRVQAIILMVRTVLASGKPWARIRRIVNIV